jgi:hypothetical protein
MGNKSNFPIWVLVEVCFSSTYLKMGFKWDFFPLLGNKWDKTIPLNGLKLGISLRLYFPVFMNWEFYGE